jgi:hypothetical protein
MRAVGFFLSEAEAAALLAHVQFLSGLQPEAPSAEGAVQAAAAAPAPGMPQQQRPGSPRADGGGAAAAAATAAGAGLAGGVAPAAAAPGQELGVDLGAFLALYANHRPLEDKTLADLGAAFEALGAPLGGAVDGRALLEALQSGGEHMGDEELRRVMQVLTGAESPEEALRGVVTPGAFASALLGFALGGASGGTAGGGTANGAA